MLECPCHDSAAIAYLVITIATKVSHCPRASISPSTVSAIQPVKISCHINTHPLSYNITCSLIEALIVPGADTAPQLKRRTASSRRAPAARPAAPAARVSSRTRNTGAAPASVDTENASASEAVQAGRPGTARGRRAASAVVEPAANVNTCTGEYRAWESPVGSNVGVFDSYFWICG